MRSKLFNSLSVFFGSSLLILSGIGIYHLMSYLQARAYVQIDETRGMEEILLSGWGLLVPIGILLAVGLTLGVLVTLGSAQPKTGKVPVSKGGQDSADLYAYAIANAMAEVSGNGHRPYRPGDALLHMDWVRDRLDDGDSQKKITKELSDRIKETYLSPAPAGDHKGVV